MPAPGELWRHDRFYRDMQTGELLTKYLLVLAVRGGDVVHRLLTSRRLDRPYHPPCFHGDPYPGFYLGVPGGELEQESWLDLRERDNFDVTYVTNLAAAGQMVIVGTIAGPQLCEVLLCAATAQDTTRRQSDAMYDVRGQLVCA